MDQNVVFEYYAIIKNKISQGNFESALGSIDKLLYNFPNDIYGYYYKAVCEFAQNKHEESIRDYKIVIQLEPGFAKAYFNLGVCYYVYHFYDDALINIGKALFLFTRGREQDSKQRCIEAIKYIDLERCSR